MIFNKFIFLVYIFNIIIQLLFIFFSELETKEYKNFFLLMDSYLLLFYIINSIKIQRIFNKKSLDFSQKIIKTVTITIKDKEFLVIDLFYILTVLVSFFMYPDVITWIIFSIFLYFMVIMVKIITIIDILDYLDFVNEKLLNNAVEEITILFKSKINYNFLFKNKIILISIILILNSLIYLFYFNIISNYFI